ncbi:MAG TPA: helix-turn-helix domain-containing protein [Stellaceae bacterium]|jgi:HTH-type transcriptional regulator/antitoxin HigA|nr:helix-turn-helix domain-containing protein [Stellaceae bacterium]
MDIRPIHNEAEYDAALAEIDQYFVNEPTSGTPEGDRFEVLLALIGAYEQKHWRIEAPDAVSAIKEMMAIKNLTQSDLAELLGSRSRASEILNRRRRLTMDQAKLLHEKWQVPAESLLAG